MTKRMTDEDLQKARNWAEDAEPYPVKNGFLTLLDEIDRLRRYEQTDNAGLVDQLHEVTEINRKFEADRGNLRTCIAGLIDGMHPDLGGDTHINGHTVRFLRAMFGITS